MTPLLINLALLIALGLSVRDTLRYFKQSAAFRNGTSAVKPAPPIGMIILLLGCFLLVTFGIYMDTR